MHACIALLRGINVGKAKRIAMADLRKLIEALGHRQVSTLLNSGNAVFWSERKDFRLMAQELVAAIVAKCGFSIAVVVLAAAELEAIIAANPLPEAAAEPARFLVAFLTESAALEKLHPLADQDWAPDQFAIGPHAAYLWCRTGILDSKLAPALLRVTDATTRNWATVLKLQERARG